MVEAEEAYLFGGDERINFQSQVYDGPSTNYKMYILKLVIREKTTS